MERNLWVVLHTIMDRRIWLVGLHMVDADNLIMFGGQAISDNNMKYNQIMRYDIEQNMLNVKQQQLLKPKGQGKRCMFKSG